MSGVPNFRLDVYRELLCSEQTYIKDLTILQEAYEVPLYRDLTKKNCYLNKLELDSIFGNYHEILKVGFLRSSYEQIHTDFFNSIKTHMSEARLSQLISQEFLKTSNQFYLYNDYCNSYYDALRLLQRLLADRPGLDRRLELLQKDPRSKGHDIFSYLIKPIQVRARGGREA